MTTRRARALTPGWLGALLGEIPAASRYKADLDELVNENARLRAELRALRRKGAPRKSGASASKEDARKILAFLQRREYATAAQIAQSIFISRDAVDRYLQALMERSYIKASSAIGQDPEYYLGSKGKRYLEGRGSS